MIWGVNTPKIQKEVMKLNIKKIDFRYYLALPFLFLGMTILYLGSKICGISTKDLLDAE